MTRKRGRGAKRAKDEEEERPEKKVKFADDVSNRDTSDEEYQEAQSDQETSTRYAISTRQSSRQRAMREKLKIKISSPPKPKKTAVGKKKKEAKSGMNGGVNDGASGSKDPKNETLAVSVRQEDDATASTEASRVADHLPGVSMEISNTQTVTAEVHQEDDAGSASTYSHDLLSTGEEVESLQAATVVHQEEDVPSVSMYSNDLSSTGKEVESSQAAKVVVHQEEDIPSASMYSNDLSSTGKEVESLQAATVVVHQEEDVLSASMYSNDLSSTGKEVESSQAAKVVVHQEDVPSASTSSHDLLSTDKEVESLQAAKVVVHQEDVPSASTSSHDLLSTGKEVESLQAVTVIPENNAAGASTSCDLSSPGDKVESSLMALLAPEVDGASATESAHPLILGKETDKSSHEGQSNGFLEECDGSNRQLHTENLEMPHEEEDNLARLFMDLEDTPMLGTEESNVVWPVEGFDDYVILPTTLNIDMNKVNANIESSNRVTNETTENEENENTENRLAEKKKTECDQEVPKVHTPLAEKITEKILMEAAKQIHIKKTKSTKVKHTVPFKNKGGKTQRSRKKSVQSEVEPASPPAIQQTVDEEDEIICGMCDQSIENGLIHDNGEPLGGFEEGTAILDSRLLLFDGDEANVSTEDTRSYNKITSFNVYCKNGHLCRFDSGLIEKDVEIYFSGYVKPIHSEDPSAKDGVPGKRFGPIASWWMTGFDVGEQPTVGLSTELGDYICMEPSAEYAPFMRSVMRKIYISKIVIEFLIYEPNASYEDLLAKLQTTPVPNNLMENFTEDTLLHYAQFICDQVITFDDTAKPKEQLMVTAPCIRRLIDLAGIRFEVDTSECPDKGNQIFRERQFEHKIDYREKLLRQAAEDRGENSNASELIDILLPIHEKFLTPHAPKPWRCGACERCLRSQCRECKACSARNYEACYQRRCFNREIMEENEEDAQDEIDFSEMQAEDSLSLYRTAVRPLARHTCDIAWGTKPLVKEQTRTYYGSVYVDRQLVSPGDYIDVRSSNPGVPPQIMKVAYMYEDEGAGHARIHACFLWSGKYTILGDISDGKELFFVNRCIDIDATCVVRKVQVLERPSRANLDSTVMEDLLAYPYVCQRSYDPYSGSFHDLEPHDEEARGKRGAPHRYCWVCDRLTTEKEKDAPEPFNQIGEISGMVCYQSLRYKDEEYHVGSAVYLKPKSLYFKYPMLNGQPEGQSSNADEDTYTEVYRKAKDEEPVDDVPAPFDIGYVTHIFKNEGRLFLKVLKLYRPENTSRGEKLGREADANVLYWSDEDIAVPFKSVVGKCYLAHESSTPNAAEWSRQGPDRFYFSQICRNNDVVDDIVRGEYGCPTELCDAPRYPDVKLKTLNIFAGCGALALGLQQAGAAECRWAIESDKAAAATFKLNNPGAAVFTGTCAEMMEKISKKDFKVSNQRLPKKGDVELLCATLPSESWRDINTVTAFKSSNIATFLVYLEHYQPPFFVFEADDVLLKRSIVLKLALASFIRLGYQVAFDLVQVGNFGAPQNRYRTVIVGAARGRSLPNCPRSQYAFSKSSSIGRFVIDNRMYHRRNWTDSAPYRATTVRDAISDLSAIDFDQGEVAKYAAQSLSFYQRMSRYDLTESDRSVVHNHVTKNLGPLVHARMSKVPVDAGSDWRDLPNVEFQLPDNTVTNKLVYAYDDPELGRGKRGQPRGVCSCSVGKRCDPSYVRENTIIPWHLVHSGKRHGHWAGLYGKLQWDGIFVGTSTNPEPLAKKAPVIHPSQNRVLSVRECARAQGFPDTFVFAAGFPIHQMYRQIGSATSPLLARAIGHELAKCAALP